MVLAHNNYPRTPNFFIQDNSNICNTTTSNNHHNSSTLDAFDSDSIVSSPHSTYNYQSSTTPSSAGFDFPRRHITNNYYYGQSLTQVPDLMPSESYLIQQSYQQTPRATQRMSHNRESSLSSLNSNGPASPYNASISNPQIAVNDSADGFHDLGGDTNYSYHLGKPMTNDNFYASIQGLGSQANGLTDMSFADGMSNLATQQTPQQRQHQQQHQQKRYDGRGLLPAADVALIGSTTRSHPASVASSTVGGDSQPATPSFQEPIEDESRRRKNGMHRYPPRDDLFSSCSVTVFANVPKLDRTMTDVYSDELYSPHFTITSASPQPPSQAAVSPNSGVFAERLALANNQHLSAVQSPASSTSRTNSPFRHGSPLAPASSDFNPQIRLNSAQQMREQQKQEQDTKALQEQLSRQQQGTPSTISPKDAMLDFNDSDDGSNNFPLFPSQETTSNFDMNQLNKSVAQQLAQPQVQVQVQVQQRTPLQTAFDFSMPSNIQMPQQYPFIARPRQQQTPSVANFSRMSSADTTGSSGSDVVAQRPARTGGDGGTYTCTYHGCTLRFETPQQLQKHKREGHRQANALTATKPVAAPSPGAPETLLGSQAGPHRCDRINPSTGKPCSTVFSRPYDLTRHEDTIHNARKRKVRCDLCTEEKTFSRADALTRHYRVCHPDVDFPGKHRRGGGSE